MQIIQCMQQAGVTRLDAEILIAEVLQVNRAYLYSHQERVLTQREIDDFQEKIKRRQQGEPIAYITNRREFWSLELMVTPATLIPRPETELLVEAVLDCLPQHIEFPLLELGTGSGAISIAIARERPHWRILATDITKEALAVAKSNAVKHATNNITFLESDWYEKIHRQQFSAIVSNPPYIAEDDIHLSLNDIRFEPTIALVSGNEGFKAITHIIEGACSLLAKGGWLFLEHGFSQAAQVCRLLQDAKFTQIETRQDLNLHPRITFGKYC